MCHLNLEALTVPILFIYRLIGSYIVFTKVALDIPAVHFLTLLVTYLQKKIALKFYTIILPLTRREHFSINIFLFKFDTVFSTSTSSIKFILRYSI